jgi:ATP-dependent Clp protease protease subunit
MSDLTIYGEIGWDATAASFHRALAEQPAGKVTVRLNSPGGSVFDGLAIGSLVRNHGKVIAVVDGLAASAASIIFIAASRRVMAPGTMLMIHNPWSMVGGTSNDMRKEAEVLDTIAGEMAKLYADASGGKLTAKEAEKLMDAETWLTAEQAVEIGLADAIEGKAKAYASIDKSRHAYRNIPKGLETMSTETPEAKPSILDSILAKIGGGAEVKAELETAKAELSEAQSALVDAVAKITEAEARASEAVAALAIAKAEHEAQLEKIQAEHIAALESATASARIEGAQNHVAGILSGSAPEPLGHIEPEPSEPALERWNRLHAEGKRAEAFAHYEAHRTEIDKARKSGKE